MNKKIFIFLVISLIVSVVSYIALENIYISVGILLFYLLISVFFISPLINKYNKQITKFHECYHFINNFIISLSIKKSITGALETTVPSMPSEFNDMFAGLENMSENEKLNYLSTYFEFYDYQLFLQIIFLWEEQGGDVVAMSKYLLSDIRDNEEYVTKSSSLATHKYVEVGILWSITLLVIVVLRFALKDFYDKIIGQLVYMISISAILIFILFSIYMLVKKGTSIEIRGYSQNEKNI